MKTVKHTALSLAAVLGAGLLASTAQAEVSKLKAASFLPGRVIYAKFFYRWVKEVNKQCDGKVNISVVGPAAIKSIEQWKAMRAGTVDMHYGPSNYYSSVLPEADVTNLATNQPAAQRKNGAWKILNEYHNKKLNAQYLTYVLGDVPFYIYTKTPAKNGRFDGRRIRSVPVYDDLLKALGAQPRHMGAPAVYTALERGAVEGFGWPLWAVTDFGWHRFVKYRHGPGFFGAQVNILMNLDRYKKMPAANRDCLNRMVIWLEKVAPGWEAAEHKKQMAAQDKAGIKYVDLGPGFKKLAHDLMWKRITKVNPGFIKQIRPLITK